jgi:hypothetical protein
MASALTGRPRWLLATGLAAAGVVLLAGCGSVGSAASGTTGASTAGEEGTVASSDTQMDAFASCLGENGVTLPEPSGGPQGGPPAGGGADGGAPPEGAAPGAGATPPAPEGVDADTCAAALQACADTMPTPPDGGAPPARPEEG